MLHRLTGVQKRLEVYDDKIIITQTSIIEKMAHGFKGEKSIYISDISSIQVKQPGFLTNGYIQFALPGAVERTGGLSDAVSDENTVFYAKQKQDLVLKIKATIERIKKEQKTGHVIVNHSSDADEIAKLKKLHDEGVITADEFESKKKQLLGIYRQSPASASWLGLRLKYHILIANGAIRIAYHARRTPHSQA